MLVTLNQRVLGSGSIYMVLKSKFSVRNLKYEADLLNELKEYYDSWVEAKKMFDGIIKGKKKKGYHV